MTETFPATAAPQPAAVRRRVLILAALALLLGLIGGVLWWQLLAPRRVTTDDAHVGGVIARITAPMSAPVRAVLKRDGDAVHAGEVLVVLDDAGARSRLDEAEAELDRAIRRARGFDAADTALEAQIAARLGDVRRAETKLARVRSALGHAPSDHSVAEAEAELASIRAALAQAHANRTAAQAALAANRALASGAAADTPEVAKARAQRDSVRRDTARALLRAPMDGVIAQRQVQAGQQIAANTTLMAVVPVELLYVDARYADPTLSAIKPGQTAELTSRTYGGGVTYHGRVVQRIPVRIRLDPAELRAHPLAIGAAMTATVTIDP